MPEPEDLSKEKLEWELKKIKAEVQHLSRPWIRTPASWAVLATTLIAFTTTAVQWYKSDIDYRLAEIKKERTAFETEKLERLRAQYSAETASAQLKLAALQKQTLEASANLELAEKKLVDLGKRLPTTAASQAAVKEATESLKSLRVANNELSRQTARTSDSLAGITKQINGPAVFVTDVDLARFCKERFGESFSPIDSQNLFCSDGRTTTEVDRSEVCRWAYDTDEVDMDFGSLRWSCRRP